MADFLTAYNITNKTEGGYSNDPTDRGGETYAGITRRNFPHWHGWNIVDANKPLKQGQFIFNSQMKLLVMSFYHDFFWMAINGDKIRSQDLANQVYDMAVNAGIETALNILKQS